MHEMSIAQAIHEIAVEQAGARRVTRVGLRIGHLRQVVPSALHFSFELIANGTSAEGATLEVEDVAAVARCHHCGGDSEQDGFPLHCGECDSFSVRVIRGEELSVEWVELEEPAMRAANETVQTPGKRRGIRAGSEYRPAAELAPATGRKTSAGEVPESKTEPRIETGNGTGKRGE